MLKRAAIALLLCTAACDPDAMGGDAALDAQQVDSGGAGGAPGAQGGAAATGGASALGGAQAGTGGAGAGGAAAGQGGGTVPGTGGAVLGGAGGTQGGAGGAPAGTGGAGGKTYPWCASGSRIVDGCGHLGPRSTWVSMFKDGRTCGVCRWKRPTDGTVFTDQRWGCQVEGAGDGGQPILCVQTCGECSY